MAAPPHELEPDKELASKLDRLAQEMDRLTKEMEELKSLKSLKEELVKLVPEERVPCPGCGAEVPKSKLPVIEEKLAKKYRATERVVEKVPVEVPKEVPKPEITWDLWTKTAMEAFPERPGEEALRALDALTKKAAEKGWLKVEKG